MTVQLCPTFGVGYQAFTTGGLPLNAGTIDTYIAGGTTPQATYTTSAGNVANANPIVLGADGRPPSEIWLTSDVSYRFDLKDSLGNLIKTYDNIPSVGSMSTQSITTWQNSTPLHIGGIAGTNTITGTMTPTLTALAADQVFNFIPAATNTGATTINIDSLGAKNVYFGGAACSGGELLIGVPAIVEYDGTQFNVIGGTLPSIRNVLSGTVSLSNTANYYDGPSVAQGTVGTWYVSGAVSVYDSAGAATIFVKLWDGTTEIASGIAETSGANKSVLMHLSGLITSPAGNLRISARDSTATTGVIQDSSTGITKMSNVTAIRIK